MLMVPAAAGELGSHGSNCHMLHCGFLACVTGHQLHYDSDDEGQGGVRNPIFTSVLYLAPNTSSSTASTSSSSTAGCEQQPSFVGGPTLITDQVLGGPLAAKGWLAYPAANRFTMFDGRYLHGEW